MLPQSALDHDREQRRLATTTRLAVRRQWARLGGDWDAGWTEVRPAVAALVTAGQLASVREADAYVGAVVDELGLPADVEGAVSGRLAGWAADGRGLAPLLDGALVTAKTSGAPTAAEALAFGGRWLDLLVATTLADTSRTAEQVAIVARPRITGYVRMLQAPSCARCAILAGKWFRWHADFLRHPRCDCRSIPASENVAGDLTTDPVAAVRAGQVRGLSEGDRKALADGADLNRVVNASRGMSTASPRGRGRVTPASIYRQAGDDRAEAVRMLKRAGYIT